MNRSQILLASLLLAAAATAQNPYVRSGAGIAVIPAGAADMEVKLGLLAARPIAPARRITINAYRSRQALARRKEVLLEQMIQPGR